MTDYSSLHRVKIFHLNPKKQPFLNRYNDGNQNYFLSFFFFYYAPDVKNFPTLH